MNLSIKELEELISWRTKPIAENLFAADMELERLRAEIDRQEVWKTQAQEWQAVARKLELELESARKLLGNANAELQKLRSAVGSEKA